mgnify:CR=1 FL=1
MNKVQSILADMVRLQASDLFITVGKPPLLKVSGSLSELAAYGSFGPADTEDCARQLFDREQSSQACAAHGEADFSLSLSQIGRFRATLCANVPGRAGAPLERAGLRPQQGLGSGNPQPPETSIRTPTRRCAGGRSDHPSGDAW